MSKVMTVLEAAEYLKVHKETVLRMIRRNELKAAKVGRSWRIEEKEIEKLLKGGVNNG